MSLLPPLGGVAAAAAVAGDLWEDSGLRYVEEDGKTRERAPPPVAPTAAEAAREGARGGSVLPAPPPLCAMTPLVPLLLAAAAVAPRTP